jgi:hypothetical protein
MRKLHLLKVIVQPVFVLIEDENATEVNHPPIAIPADEWPTYSSERFPAELKAWQAEIEAGGSVPADNGEVAVGEGSSRAARQA